MPCLGSRSHKALICACESIPITLIWIWDFVFRHFFCYIRFVIVGDGENKSRVEFGFSSLFSAILRFSRDLPVVTGGGNRNNPANYLLTQSHWKLSHMWKSRVKNQQSQVTGNCGTCLSRIRTGTLASVVKRSGSNTLDHSAIGKTLTNQSVLK